MSKLITAAKKALLDFNKDTNSSYTFGTEFSAIGTEFETFVDNYLFPKITETLNQTTKLGNRFDFLAKETDVIGQFTEEYVINDTIPINLNLDDDALNLFKRNYSQISTKIYGQGMFRKVKFTLNNNDVRLKFSTISDAVNYATGIYLKKVSDINVSEESEIKAMIVDYALNVAKEKRVVTSYEELVNNLSLAVLNMQNNSPKYNEVFTATSGKIGRYTTNTQIENIVIVTSDKTKNYLLNDFIANTFNAQGLDLSKRIISFDDLGGVFKSTKDITLTKKQVEYLNAFGDYTAKEGNTILKGTVFTFDVSEIFKGSVEEIKPQSEFFAVVFDEQALRYKRNTNNMLKQPFYNGENDEVTYWLHYYTFKAFSPCFNKIVITG